MVCNRYYICVYLLICLNFINNISNSQSITIEGSKRILSSKDTLKLAKAIVFNKKYCFETYTDHNGIINYKFNKKRNESFQIFIHYPGYLPIIVEEDDSKPIHLKHNVEFYKPRDYSDGINNDTTYVIQGKIVDSNSLPIIGAEIFIIESPYYCISQKNGSFKIFLPHYNLIQNEYLTLFINSRNYLPIKYEISKDSISENYSIDKGDIRLISFDRQFNEKRYQIILDDLNDSIDLLKSESLIYHIINDSLLSKLNDKIYDHQLTVKDFENLLLLSDTFNLFTRSDLIKLLKEKDTLNLLTKYKFEKISNDIESSSLTYKEILSIKTSVYNKILFDTLNAINEKIKLTQLISDSIKRIQTNILNMPDNDWRIYACLDYGFINRPTSSLFIKVGTKFDFTEFGLTDYINQNKFYFDLSTVLSTSGHSIPEIFDQTNLSLNYRLINRNFPYFSLDLGLGYSIGTRFDYDSLSNWTYDSYISGFNMEINLIGKVKSVGIKDTKFVNNLYVSFNTSTRFVFNGGIEFEYGMPIFGLGVIYNVYLEKHKKDKNNRNTSTEDTYFHELDNLQIFNDFK